MDKIKEGKVVEIEYTAWLEDGEMADATEGEPLAYLHGSGDLISGLEDALEGRKCGDSFRISLAAAEAFGDYDEELVEELPRSAFPSDVELEEGDEVAMIDEDGEENLGYIVGFDDDTVYVDCNHPLAGETLTYEVKVVSVRDATPDEILQGHVHDEHAHSDYNLN